MRVAVIGSRGLRVNNLEKYLPQDVCEIVSGGARGIDTCAKNYALKNGIPLKEFLPNYNCFGKQAPLVRNVQIVEYSDLVLAFWDGKSRGTKFVIDKCKELNKKVQVYIAK